MDRYPIRVAQAEAVALAVAEGRILAEDVAAAEDVPPFDRSPLDGFAVIAAEVVSATADSPVKLAIAGEVLMGKAPPQALRPGQALRVPTGGALPDGATGIVMLEDTRESGSDVEILDGSDAAAQIITRGSDVKRGRILLQRGTALSPAAVGMLAGAGIAHVSVYAKPVVSLLVSGDELVPPGDFALAPGEIRDINSHCLSAALQAMGFEVRLHPRVRDAREALARGLADAMATSDAVVISGGSSVGDRDYTPEVVSEAGEPGVIVHGVRAKPGRPTLLALIGEKPVIGLPGNPVSALVMLETLGKPILLRMFDKHDSTLPVRARLAEPIARDPKLERRVPVSLTQAADGLLATPLFGTSAQMHILGMADALVAVAQGDGRIETGAWVDAMPFSRSSGISRL